MEEIIEFIIEIIANILIELGEYIKSNIKSKRKGKKVVESRLKNEAEGKGCSGKRKVDGGSTPA